MQQRHEIDYEALMGLFPSIIPLKEKRPLESGWQRWCHKVRPFDPAEFCGKNVGLPCGPANKILVVDVDDVARFGAMVKEKGWDLPDTRVHMTGSGKPHYIFLYPHENGVTYGNRSIKDEHGNTVFDIRGIGGQVVAPGSIHPNGKPYTVRNDVSPAPAPGWVKDLARQEAPAGPERHGGGLDRPVVCPGLERLPVATKVLIEAGVPKGERSEAILSVINGLLMAGYDDMDIVAVFETHPGGIGSKYTEKGRTRAPWLLKQIDKARRTLRPQPRRDGLTQTVRDYIISIEGTFRSRDLYADLGLTSARDKDTARRVLNRLKSEGLVDCYRGESGHWRKREDRVEPMDLLNAVTSSADLWLPMDLNGLVEIMAGNLIVVSGSSNSGKTAFLLNVIKENLDQWKTHYFNSEMGACELRKRLDLFGGFPISHPNFNAYERSRDFADVIRPGEGVMNIVDFLEVTEDFYLVGRHLRDIHERLNGAVGVIAIQNRARFQHGGLGGERVNEKARLVVSLIPHQAKIIKAKSWRGDHNPNGMVREFKLVKGAKFVHGEPWHYERENGR